MANFRVSPLMTLLGAVFFFSTNVFAVAAVLGVDLGTEYIKAALVKPGIPLDIVLTKDSRRKETSAVVFKPSRNGPQAGEFPERAYGADAMALRARFPGDVYPNLKTILGLSVDDAVVQEYASRNPALQLQAHETRNTAAFKSKAFTAEEEAWMVEELLAMELQSIQKAAEAAAGDGSSVRSIVVTIPPFYTIDEKRAIQTAADLAGLKVLSLISDGLAVGLNYATSRQFPSISEGAKPEYHMVFDMGAGSTKATVMKFQSQTVKDIGKFNKTVQEVQVLGAGWDRTLGGDALNHLILDDMVAQFLESKGAQKISATAEGVKAHGRAIAKLSNQVEKVRHVLSANQNTGASFEGLYEDVDFKYKISRATFEDMAAVHAERIAAVVNDALKMSGLDIGDLDSVILHGGATRTPFVQKVLDTIVGSADKIRSNVNSDEAAVFGAGFRAAELSPSFRVKEIRITEGSSYSTSLKRVETDGNVDRQRLWSAISPQGGSRVITFDDKEDFAASIYQQVGSEEKNVKALATKNLTATVASIKEKYPTCVESDIKFKIAMELSPENGEFRVAKAIVECMAEPTEKGFVDGVKNLFGFGKKDKEDQKPLSDGETEGSEEVMKDDAAKSSSASDESAESSTASEAVPAASEGAEDAKADAKKKEVVSIPVEVTLENLGTPDLTKAELVKAKDRLKAFAASDKARLQREEALNKLEGYTYKVRDLLEDESFIAASTEKERTKLATLSSEISEWLYEDGADATKDQLKAKLKVLQDIANPVQKRIVETEKRPDLLSNLKTVLSKTDEFIVKIKSQIEEHEAWHKSASESPASSESTSSSTTEASAETPAGDFDGLEDEDAAATARKMEDVIREKGPIPPLYTLEDLTEVTELYESTTRWLKRLEPKQAALKVTDDPVLLIKDIEAKTVKLEQAGIQVAMKAAKKVEAEAKKAKKAAAAKEKKNKKKSKVPGADEKVEFNAEDFMKQFGGKDGEGPTEQELEEIIKRLQENQKKTDEKVEEKVEEKAEEGGEKQPPHDEL
ncbi:Hsp70 protein-domain-containing protein [Ilyonectria sp. MPI-CAGE-AT-0026]|nr:Hsp70 protein-domain-containing protein [Ilyonectria sp. MPI-CAGE-AT-0026]